jgi:hypothetical protein
MCSLGGVVTIPPSSMLQSGEAVGLLYLPATLLPPASAAILASPVRVGNFVGPVYDPSEFDIAEWGGGRSASPC